jgi:hypothetical protein
MARDGGDWFVIIAVELVMFLVAGWAFMLAIGVIHHEWIRSCPTIGYWWSVLLASLIRTALYSHDHDKDRR